MRATLKTCAALVLILAAACSGGGSNVPDGSVRNYSPVPAPGIAAIPVSVTVTIPNAGPAQRRAAYVSSGTKSVSFQLAALNGFAVQAQPVTVLNVAPGAPNCTAAPNARKCTGQIAGAAGQDAFTINLFANSDGTGALLAGGTVTVTVTPSGGSLALSNAVSLTLNPIVAGLQISVPATAFFTAGVRSSIPVNVRATDASGAIIVATLTAPVSLSLSGAATGVFTLSATSLSSPGQPVTLSYNGDSNVGGSITINASLTQSGTPVTATAAIPVHGAVPVPGSSGGPELLYVLNQHAPGIPATVTEYDASANGNAAPVRVLTLSSTLTAQSIAVDAAGNLHAGYAEGEIDTYAHGASGPAKPSAVLSGDSGSSTVLQPVVLAFDASGDLITIGQTMLNNNGGYTSVLVYAASATGSVPPVNAWNFNSPYVSLQGSANASISAITSDAAGNFYVAGALQSSSLSSAPGIYIAPGNANSATVNATRTIPGDSTTTIPADSSQGNIAGLAVASSGQIYESQITGSGSATLSGTINVFPAGAAGGTTDVAPLRTISGAPLAINLASGASALPIVLDATRIFAANGSAAKVLVYALNASGAATPVQTISGSATQFDMPVALALGH